jgi:hypothetical protein
MKRISINEDFEGSSAIAGTLFCKSTYQLLHLIMQQFPKVDIEQIKVIAWSDIIQNRGTVTLGVTDNSIKYLINSRITLDFNFNLNFNHLENSK